MSKKDYQAIARAIHTARQSDAARILKHENPNATEALLVNIEFNLVAVFTLDNPRFDNARFIEACETGSCKGMKARRGARRTEVADAHA